MIIRKTDAQNSALIKKVLSKKTSLNFRIFPCIFDKVYVLDGGDRSGGFFVLDVKERKYLWLSSSEFVDFPNGLKNTLIIVEHAHFCLRKKSKAQLLSEEQRRDFLHNCRKNGVTFRLFPELQTPKARSFASSRFYEGLFTKSEVNDTLSIFLYLNYFHEDIFSTLQSGDSLVKNKELVALGKALLYTNNEVLQFARNTKYLDKGDKIYQYATKYKQQVFNIIEQFCEDNDLDERHCQSVREFFDLQKPTCKNVSKVVYTIISTLIDNQGVPLKGEGSNLLGWKFVRDRILCFNSNRGGIAKSNINHHRIHSRLGKKDKKKKVKQEKVAPKKLYLIAGLKKLGPGERISKLDNNEYDDFNNQRKLWKLCIKKVFSFFRHVIHEDILIQKTMV